MLEWWRRLETDLAAVDRAIEREHQAADTVGTPWPPVRTPQPGPERVPEPESSPGSGPEADGQPGTRDQAARLDEMLGQVTEAAQRLAADNASSEARAEYTARLEREASAESEHTAQADASYEADIEL